MKTLLLGLTLFMGSLWGGSYLYSSIPINHWTHFPLLVTVVFVGLAGASVALYKVYEL
jgi:hypothetical protein